MIPTDWSAMMLGGAAGAAVSALYFAGLAWSMGHALRARSPVALLALSAAIRIAILLAAGWAVAMQAGPWAALGYAAAFVVVRIGAITAAKIGNAGHAP